jgi:hypothetical protein
MPCRLSPNVRAHLFAVWRCVLRFVKLTHMSGFSLLSIAPLMRRSTRNIDPRIHSTPSG